MKRLPTTSNCPLAKFSHENGLQLSTCRNMLQQLFHVHKRTRKIHSPLHKIWHAQWSWLLIDELGLSSRVRDMTKFCWEGTFIKLPVIVSVATNIHHFLFTLLSFHKRLLNCGQQANTARRQANTSTLSQIYPSIAPRWSKREPFSILHVRGLMLRCFSSS